MISERLKQRGNKDKELDDPQGYGAIEYAYANMAKDAGIAMGTPVSEIFKEPHACQGGSGGPPRGHRLLVVTLALILQMPG